MSALFESDGPPEPLLDLQGSIEGAKERQKLFSLFPDESKEMMCWEMRLKGMTYAEIASATDYAGPRGVYAAINRVQERYVHESVEEMRFLDGHRLDALEYKLWPIFNDESQPFHIRMRACDAILKVVERRSRLFGYETLNQPVVQSKKRDPSTEAIIEAERVIRRLHVLSELDEPGDVRPRYEEMRRLAGTIFRLLTEERNAS